MAAGIFSAATYILGGNPFPSSPRRSLAAGDSVLPSVPVPLCRHRSPSIIPSALRRWQQRRPALAVCFVVGQSRSSEITEEQGISVAAAEEEDERRILLDPTVEKMASEQSERRAYLMAAVMSILGITSLAVAAIYYRFYCQMEGGEVPVTEMLGTFALSVGAAVGMEFWSGWVHRTLWHASLWHMHESHHRPHDGPFELNDVSAIISAVPAISLLSVGFFSRGLLPDLCFGAGLGATLFWMAYMFAHDGLVHRRFPVGPIANGPYFRRVVAAHKSKFVLPSDSSDFVLKSLNHKWKEYRAKLKRDYKLEGRTEEQVVATCPPDVHPHQWMELVHYWFSERAQTYSDIGRAARAAQSVPHTAGSKSYARLRHEFADQQGREPGEVEFYRMTHVHQDGSFVRDESRDIYNRATSMISERAGEGSSSTQSSRIEAEVFSELMGPERPGRVRGYGIGVTPTQLFEVRRYTRDTRESHDQLHVRQLQEEIAELRQTRDADRAEMQTIRSQLEHVTSVLHMFMSSQVPGASASRRPDDDQPPTDQ